MKELNLHIMNNSQLSTFGSAIISYVEKVEVIEILELELFKTLTDVYDKYWKVCFKVQKNKYTVQMQDADNKQIDDYKATYYAVKSHLYLSDIEDHTAAIEMLHILKHSPRMLERMRQTKRSYWVQNVLSIVEDQNVVEYTKALNLDRWIAALKKSNDAYEAVSQAFYTEMYRKQQKGSSTKFRPELIVAMNAFFRYLDAYCTIHTDEPILHLKAMIETEYKEIRTVCRRNVTRRKNQRANAENESNTIGEADLQSYES